jgi:hypothetical protein
MAVEPILRQFAQKHSLYLDKHGKRLAREGAKVTWTDLNGNRHDLDFVIERGGTAQKLGAPVAFIETAWRRYTKHSRNKAQEIQGAIDPLFETYRRYHPFKGAVLAGEFTLGALTQLKSLGFAVAYFHYETVVEAFAYVGIDARSDEDTPDAEFAEKCRQWDALDESGKKQVSTKLTLINAEEIDGFTQALSKVILRTVKAVRILPLHGNQAEWTNVDDAIDYIRDYPERGAYLLLIRYEIQIIYINGDKISGEFGDKEAAIEFLKSYSLVNS